MNKTIETAATTEECSVSRVAYQLWENAGRPAGRDLEFWLAAEAQVRANPRPFVASRVVSTPVTPTPAPVKEQKTVRNNRGGLKKTWPKPYPSLPKF
jgi:hypothetical protein